MPDHVKRKQPIEADLSKQDNPVSDPEAEAATTIHSVVPRRPIDQTGDADEDDLFNDMPV
ncbi:hypothetical protein [Roseicyclus marinus]|uniref:hypothetical protein n=1 Tax=Roseicyclus marinus TaxID=2161673 RepID=UPI00240EF79E|nr:hypothetical protein [Roseicyclus marinus]MDG3042490.1 hypothetical protein [Roseicyclus marinus]